MSGFLAIYRREMLSLWVTPLAWVLLVVFLLLQGIDLLLASSFTSRASPSSSVETGPVQAYFGQESIFLLMSLLLVCPALTMRAFAEERRSGTIETLLTAPVTPSARRARQVRRRAHHVRRDVGADAALRRDPAQDRRRSTGRVVGCELPRPVRHRRAATSRSAL